jgi:hypothetical protein
MRAELDAYSRELRWIIDEICHSLAGLTGAQLAWRPATRAANSASAIAGHVLASTRVYALGFGCGRPVGRHRDSEFTASGTDADEMIGRLLQLRQDVATGRPRREHPARGHSPRRAAADAGSRDQECLSKRRGPPGAECDRDAGPARVSELDALLVAVGWLIR